MDSNGNLISMQMGDAQERLRRLEARDRRQWIAAIGVLLSIAAALYSFTLPNVADSLLAGRPLRYAVRSLLFLVLLFALRALREQRRMARQRRELASEMAVIGASETLRVATTPEEVTVERRSLRRKDCERPLRVTVQGEETTCYHGRVIDLSEDGMGAILPCVLAPDQEVVAEFPLDDRELVEEDLSYRDSPLVRAEVVVRQRSGFRYGFKFIRISEADRDQVRAFCKSGNVVSIARTVSGTNSAQ